MPAAAALFCSPASCPTAPPRAIICHRKKQDLFCLHGLKNTAEGLSTDMKSTYIIRTLCRTYRKLYNCSMLYH
jgi:hypothetical protein